MSDTDAPDRLTRARSEMDQAQNRLDRALKTVIAEEVESGDATPKAWRELGLGLVQHSNALRELFIASLEAPVVEAPAKQPAPRVAYTIDHGTYRKLIRLSPEYRGEDEQHALDRLYAFAGGGSEADVRLLIAMCERHGGAIADDRIPYLRSMLEG